MNSILITGCNRGLGLGLVKSLIKQDKSPKYIFATCRNLQAADVSINYIPWNIGAIFNDIKQITDNLSMKILA